MRKTVIAVALLANGRDQITEALSIECMHMNM